jgi:hypothetical protein
MTFVLVAAGNARAGDAHERAVVAFEIARRHIDAGNCAAAVPFLEESLRHEPMVGTRFSLGDCAATHDPYAAWWHFRAAALLAFLRHDERFAAAQERAAALLPSLARIGVQVPLATLETPGFEILIDGKPVDRFHVAAGVVAAAPGEHLIEARDAKGRRFRRGVVTERSDAVLVRVVLEEPMTAPPIPPPAPGAEPPPTTSSSSGRTVGLALGATGIGVMLVGGAFGLAAMQNGSELDRACNGDSTRCTGHATRIDPVLEAGDTNATVSTILLATGALLVAGGAYLFFTAKSAQGPRTAVVTW